MIEGAMPVSQSGVGDERYLGLTPLQTRVLAHYSDNCLPVDFRGNLAGWGTSVRALWRRRMLTSDTRGISLNDKGKRALSLARPNPRT